MFGGCDKGVEEGADVRLGHVEGFGVVGFVDVVEVDVVDLVEVDVGGDPEEFVGHEFGGG